MSSQHRNIYYLIAIILIGVVLLAILWEFALEDRLVPYIYEYYHPKPMYERIEYVISVLVLVIISLVIPTRLAIKYLSESDQAKYELSSAYDDLEKRVQDRTHDLTDANEQLKLAITERQQTEDALRASEKELRLLSSQLLIAQENERRRIALDLHDNVIQTLVAMKIRVEQNLEGFDDSTVQSAEQMNIFVSRIQESIEEVRNMYMKLRPSILDDLSLSAALTWLCRDFQDTHPEIHLQSRIDLADREIHDPLKVVIYRVVQEALYNVARHSKANQVNVILTWENDNLELTVQDNGIGFSMEDVLSVDDSLRGIGLSGMRERAQLVGGTFRIDSEKGNGTLINASWPIQ